MALSVVTVASGGLPVVETTRGMPVSEASNLRGLAVTKVVGKAGLPVTYVSGSGGMAIVAAGGAAQLGASGPVILTTGPAGSQRVLVNEGAAG